jgi:6-phosphofructokinase 2
MANRIVTLTLSPSIDVSTSTPIVRPEHKLRCTPGQRDPGGGGLNVSRVVHELGADTFAVFPSGGATGRLLEERLSALDIPFTGIMAEQDTRICFNAGESESGREFRFVLPGAPLTPEELEACILEVEEDLEPGDVLVASGSLPPGSPTDTYAQIVRRARARGARVVLDTSQPALGPALDEPLLLVKPSRRELGELLGRPVTETDELAAICRELYQSRQVEVLVVSMGKDGALMTSGEGQWMALPPAVEARSAVGAGDSFVAAMTLALMRGDSHCEALEWATAAGAAALITQGTGLCRRADVERLRPLARCVPIRS